MVNTIGIMLVIILGAGVFFLVGGDAAQTIIEKMSFTVSEKNQNNQAKIPEEKTDMPQTPPAQVGQKKANLIEPISAFTKRITKKPFGIYITPETSPVRPERFSGYHTGADAETAPSEKDKNMFVYAVSDGRVITVKNASGYGGLVVIEHMIAGKRMYGIYGHLRLDSIILLPQGKVTAGDVIGVLGEGYSKETDGERKHLHFGLYQGDIPDIRGYVQTKDELSNWLNPLQFF